MYVTDSVVYELQHLSLNAVTFYVLTKMHRFIADWIQWFPKQDIHYVALILITLYSISADKRAFNERPSFDIQGVRAALNLALILTSNFLMGFICDFSVKKGGDPDEALQLKCAGGVFGEVVVSYIYRLLILSFLRSVMIGIQFFNNIFYRFDLM